jgi:phospholipase C
MMINRRDALKRLGGFAGAAVAAPHFLTGCDDPEEAGITHFIVICMENRSYDHFLGARALEGLGGDGLAAGMANPRLDGTSVEMFRGETACVVSPPHSWTRAHAQWNGGALDGFLRQYEEQEEPGVMPEVMSYFGRQELPVLWALADEYTTCDRWFAGLLGPTWPNRLFLYAGESGGMISNDIEVVGTLGLNTILHRLMAMGVPYRTYFSDVPFAALLTGLPGTNNKPIFTLFDDIEKGELPPVVYIDPGFSSNDDHPPHHPILGQQFIGSIYTALANSPLWKNCMVLVTYDENGGFYDHVPPPMIDDARPTIEINGETVDGFNRLGFRVPALAFGPYVKRNYVSSQVFNHASVVRHFEKMYGLPSITPRVAASPDLTDLIDLPRLAAGDWLPAPPIPEVVVDRSMIGPECRSSIPKEPGELEQAADTGRFGLLDRRKYAMDDLEAIASVLERFKVGGIRKNF